MLPTVKGQSGERFHLPHAFFSHQKHTNTNEFHQHARIHKLYQPKFREKMFASKCCEKRLVKKYQNKHKAAYYQKENVVFNVFCVFPILFQVM